MCCDLSSAQFSAELSTKGRGINKVLLHASFFKTRPGCDQDWTGSLGNIMNQKVVDPTLNLSYPSLKEEKMKQI